MEERGGPDHPDEGPVVSCPDAHAQAFAVVVEVFHANAALLAVFDVGALDDLAHHAVSFPRGSLKVRPWDLVPPGSSPGILRQDEDQAPDAADRQDHHQV